MRPNLGCSCYAIVTCRPANQSEWPVNEPVSAVLRIRARAMKRPRLAAIQAAFLVLASATLAGPAAPVRAAALPTNAAGLFNLTNVWTVHLRFTRADWEALEPASGPGRFPFGGPPARGAQGPAGARPGGFGGFPGAGPPGGPGGFGPGQFLSPAWLRAGDVDGDGRLAQREFHSLAEKWFTNWDTNKAGRLDLEQVRAGLNRDLGGGPPNIRPWGGGPDGPGEPGGPGGRGPGMNLRGREGQRNGLAAALGIDFPTVRAELEFEGRLFPAVSVRYKGNGTFLQSRGSLKRSLKVDLNDVFRRQTLAGVSKLNLHNCVTDASWMNEVLSHRLFRDAGVPAPRTTYARVYLSVPNAHDREFIGLYSLVENVDRDFALDRFGTRKGALFKPVTRQVFEDLGNDWAAYRQIYDPKTPVSEEETRRVIAFCKLVSHANDQQFAAELGDYLDLDEFARFMAVTVWLSTLDSILGPGQNFLVHLHPVTRRFQFIPWDLDHSFGQFAMIGTQEQRENLSLQRPWQGRQRFLERVFAVPAFQELYRARLAEFNRTIFQPERLARQVDELAAALRAAVAEESTEKLARFDQVVAGQPVGPEGFGGFGFGTPPKPIKGFVAARWKSVEDQLAGRSPGLTLGEGFGPGRPGGPGGPGGFGPGMFVGPAFLTALDADRDGRVARMEMIQGFERWFVTWDADKNGSLNDAELRDGLNQALATPPPDGPGGPVPGRGGFGPPGAGGPFGPRSPFEIPDNAGGNP